MGATHGCFTTFMQPSVFWVEDAEWREAPIAGRFCSRAFVESFLSQCGRVALALTTAW